MKYRMRQKIILGFLFLAICFVLTGCTSGTDKASEHVYSHRGASGEETEHTFAAYDLASLYGSKYIEQDIVISKDGTLYVSHDLSANRLCKVDKLFENMTDEEIDALTVKSNQHVLKLSDVFEKYGDTVNYVIELKSSGKTVEKFNEIIKQFNIEKKVLVQSFHADVLEKVEETYPNMPKLFLVNEQEEFNEGVGLSWVDVICVNKKIMTKENCDKAHKQGKQFNAWTLNSMEEIKKAIDIGADTYFTNYTAKALALENLYRKP